MIHDLKLGEGNFLLICMEQKNLAG